MNEIGEQPLSNEPSQEQYEQADEEKLTEAERIEAMRIFEKGGISREEAIRLYKAKKRAERIQKEGRTE